MHLHTGHEDQDEGVMEPGCGVHAVVGDLSHEQVSEI